MDSWLGFICLLLVAQINVCRTEKIWVDPNYPKKLVIDFEDGNNPVIPLDLNYKKYEQISFLHLKTNELTTKMQSISANATVLVINDSVIGSAHLMKQHKKVYIVNCRLENLIINPSGMHQTQQLRLNYNALKKLPKHLNVLKKLERLYLDDNEIEFIDMAEFNGLNNLGMLALQNNKITEIKATLHNPVILPQIKQFDASQNNLTDISFEHWNATLLSVLYLDGNQLQIAISLPGKFTELRRVTLGDNPLNCEWLQSILKELQERRVEINDQHNSKCNAAGPDLKEIVRRVHLKEMIVTFPFLQNRQSKLENVLENQLKNFDAFSRNVSTNFEHLKQQIFNITKTIDSSKLESNKSLESKTDQKLNELQKSLSLRLDLLQKLVLNTSETTNQHLLESDERKNKIKTTEFQELEQKLDELQHQQHTRFAAILVVLSLFCCFYVIKKIVNSAACTDRIKHFHESVIQVRSFADALQQTEA